MPAAPAPAAPAAAEDEEDEAEEAIPRMVEWRAAKALTTRQRVSPLRAREIDRAPSPSFALQLRIREERQGLKGL